MRIRVTQKDAITQAVELDGRDISRSLLGVSINLKAGHLPEVVLDLRVIEIEEVDIANATVIVDSHIVETLKALGWTPP